MAFPVVETTNVTDGVTASATATVNLPASIAAGDLLIVIHRTAVLGAHGYPAGWTVVLDTAGDASDDQTSWAWRKADGGEGASISVTQGNGKYSSTAYRISGAADPTVTPPQQGTEAVGDSVNPDPSITTPTGGAKDYLWIACATFSNESTTTITWPTGYASPGLRGQSGVAGAAGTNCRTLSTHRTNNAASEDPDTYTISVSSEWTAWTIAVHPSGGEPPPPVTFNQAVIMG